MEQIVAALSNSQVWTVIFSGLAGLAGALAPIIAAKIEAAKAAAAARAEVDKAAEQAKVTLKANARKDAVEEWQKLYGERDKQVRDLQSRTDCLQNQNHEQQKQIDTLKEDSREARRKHEDCEDRHATLERKVESLTGTVTEIKNGGHK